MVKGFWELEAFMRLGCNNVLVLGWGCKKRKLSSRDMNRVGKWKYTKITIAEMVTMIHEIKI